MSNKIEYKCPECGSPINAWADLDATVKFSVSSAGKLTKKVISNNYQSDGRCGVECTKCDWVFHGQDIPDDDPLHDLANAALDAQESIHVLAAKRSKS
ncbi:hypothetical protein ACTG2K_22850 [Aeromonas caviae]|uniref:hypothetical protein n=1 Tax=Aeromonas TaxID=642 RepID=UPI0029D6D91D|nr:hypothetical protein [Aeromonas caviae]MDX7853099.1 hypothetical protein [Aeromonas caviae]